jgi:hypothetical protein
MPSKANGNGNQVLETGKIRRSDCAWGQPFESAPWENPLLRLMARIVLCGIAAADLTDSAASLTRLLTLLAAQFYGHFE